MTICHVTPSGQQQTLTLPKNAALAHLANHPLDFAGACPIIEPEPEPEIIPESIVPTHTDTAPESAPE